MGAHESCHLTLDTDCLRVYSASHLLGPLKAQITHDLDISEFLFAGQQLT